MAEFRLHPKWKWHSCCASLNTCFPSKRKVLRGGGGSLHTGVYMSLDRSICLFCGSCENTQRTSLTSRRITDQGPQLLHSEICHCVGKRPCFLGSSSQWLSTAGALRQARPWETQGSSDSRLWSPKRPAKPSLCYRAVEETFAPLFNFLFYGVKLT